MLNSTKNKKQKGKSRLSRFSRGFSSGKKISILLLSILLVNAGQAQSPDWLWAKAMGGTGDDYGNSIAVDTSGNVYTTGDFWGTSDFDPGAGVFNLTPVGSADCFISKLDNSGNFVWAKQIGGLTEEYGHSITIDPAGSGAVYTTGDFWGTVDFDPGVGVFNLTSAGLSEIFISKSDSSGNLVWAKAFGGINNDYGFSVAIDPTGSGNVYTTGYFSGTVDFDPGVGVFNLTGGGGFISKLDSSGNFIWAKAIDVGSYSIAIDKEGSGGVYTTGYFYGTTDFDPDSSGSFNLTSAGDRDIFISKLDSSGNFVWAKAMGGPGYDESYSIAIDTAGSGNVYTTGWFNGTADFDPDSSGSFNLTSAAGGYDIFISKLDSSGNFVWAKQMGGTSTYDAGSSIAIDPTGSGDVYTTGYFNGTADFDPGTGVFNFTTIGVWDNGFISKLDGSGNFIWAKQIGGTGGDKANSITFDAYGHLHVAGYFGSPFITFGSTTLTKAGGYSDIFIAKLDSELGTGIESANHTDGISVFPNPATNYLAISFGSNNKRVDVSITDITGLLIYKTAATQTEEIVVNTKDFSAGVYLVHIQAADFAETKKIIVAK